MSTRVYNIARKDSGKDVLVHGYFIRVPTIGSYVTVPDHLVRFMITDLRGFSLIPSVEVATTPEEFKVELELEEPIKKGNKR